MAYGPSELVTSGLLFALQGGTCRACYCWIVGMKLCWLINDRGEVVAWDWDTANVHDQTFLPLIAPWGRQTIVLADTSFADADGIPTDLNLCPRGTWNEHMLVQTTLSLATLVFGLKKVFHRTMRYFAAVSLMSPHYSTAFWRSSISCGLSSAL